MRILLTLMMLAHVCAAQKVSTQELLQMARMRTLPHTAGRRRVRTISALCCCYPWAGGACAFFASAPR